MADHILQQIREAVANVLQASAGVGEVFKGRRSPLPDATTFPVVNIRSIDESITRETIDDLVTRSGSLILEVTTREEDDCEPALFEQQKLIEKAIMADPTLGGLTLDMHLASSRQEEKDESDAKHNLEMRVLTFDFQVATLMSSPDTAIN